MAKTNLRDLQTWVDVPDNSDFTIQNLPFGIFRQGNRNPRVGVAIGNHVLDLSYLFKKGYLDDLFINNNVFRSRYLNKFIRLGKPYWTTTRNRIIELLDINNGELRDHSDDVKNALIPLKKVELLPPVKVYNYTDFYSSLEHASNVGKMFRPDGDPLLPNWKHLPVAYHGRASSIVLSGTSVRRPKGQIMPAGAEKPVFGASKLLDFELEMAFIVGHENTLGEPVPVSEAENHIFGMLIFNDWSARDIQKWEYVPLGPFLGKNFASSISPWIVTMDALEYFRTQGPEQSPEPLEYLKISGERTFDIKLEVYIQPDNGKPTRICESNYKYLYWNMAQQLAHHTIGGCNMQVGDICASGTISGPSPTSFGSMLELSWGGTQPVTLDDGTERKFLQDGDTVIMKAYCEKDGVRIGFGEVSGKILPAL